jgi:hypothetical protein
MKQFTIDQCLYAFLTAHNIAMQEDKTEIENNKKMREVWEEIDFLRERVRHLEYNPQVYQPQVPFDRTPVTIGCSVCGISSNPSNPMGYVCPRSECPSKVTCGTAKVKGLYD